MSAPLQVIGIGNAIVDVIARAEDDFVTAESLPKGGMTLIDSDRAEQIYSRMGPALEMSGGSAGNTIHGIAALGGKAGYIGKVRNDQLGKVFRHDINAAGVDFPTEPAVDGGTTARCLVMVTPDAQRTMATYLGACVDLGPDDIDPGFIARADVTYLEGYLWDPPEAKSAFIKAAKAAHAAGKRVALSLSDPFCVDRHRAEFRELVEHHVDILFANEAEITALYEKQDFDAAVQTVSHYVDIAALTQSEKGATLLERGEVVRIPAAPVEHVVDTTGAGDLFAAGMLFGLTNGMGIAESGSLGALCAAEVIGHYGARPETDLKALAGV
ncbi:MAG: adenosine kinase [Alphaproteobacteria bacterium]|nr:adenosine kinase [Alphaproteobacteria bacterium]